MQPPVRQRYSAKCTSADARRLAEPLAELLRGEGKYRATKIVMSSKVKRTPLVCKSMSELVKVCGAACRISSDVFDLYLRKYCAQAFGCRLVHPAG